MSAPYQYGIRWGTKNANTSSGEAEICTDDSTRAMERGTLSRWGRPSPPRRWRHSVQTIDLFCRLSWRERNRGGGENVTGSLVLREHNSAQVRAVPFGAGMNRNSRRKS